MLRKNSYKIGADVIEKEITALKKLKFSIGNSFEKIIKAILKCKNGKIIISGVGKSGIIAKKWSATLSSTGTPSFFLDASNASHGDLGQISSNDIVILISLSGDTGELKNIIQFCSRNKNIKLIGITSKKNSLLFKHSDLKFLLPLVQEAGPGSIVPTSSTTVQLALGDAVAISCMVNRNFGKLDFKKFHPGGSLSIKLKTVEDLMLTGNKIPFINHNETMDNALKVINKKKLGTLIIRHKFKTVGILTDGDIKRLSIKYDNFKLLKIKKIMNKSPIIIDKDMLASQALYVMNKKKITSLCINDKKAKNKTIGIIHIHNILNANIN